MPAEEHHSGFEEMLNEKVGGVPAWGIGLGLAGLILVVLVLRGKSQTPTPAPPDPGQASPENEPSGSEETFFGTTPFGTTDIMGFPPEGIPKPTTNTQWARVVADYLIASGDDPQLVTAALWNYLNHKKLTRAEEAVIQVALRSPFGEPPQGLIGPPLDPGSGTGKRGKKVRVPNVEGQQAHIARQHIEAAHLKAHFEPEEVGIVAFQKPVPGRSVNEGSEVTLHMAATGRANDASNKTPAGNQHGGGSVTVNITNA